jgi:hypothetical protein
MSADEAKVVDETAGYDADKPPLPPFDGDLKDGEDGEDGDDAEGAPDMAGLEAMMGGMGGGGEDGEDGGMGGMDMNALMQMMGKGGGKGGGGMDMASMMGGMGGMGGGMGGMGGGTGGMGGGGKGGGKGAPEEDEEKTCEKYVWSQKGEEVHIRIALDPPASGKKDVDVKFKSNSLKVSVRGESIIDGSLGGKLEADDCTWCFSPSKDELQVMLTKVEGKTESWRDLLA